MCTGCYDRGTESVFYSAESRQQLYMSHQTVVTYASCVALPFNAGLAVRPRIAGAALGFSSRKER